MQSINQSRIFEQTHTHPFNGPFSGSTRVGRYQRGKTNLDFNEVRDSEWQWHQLGHMQVCTSLQTDNHARTSPFSLLQAGYPSCRPTNSVKALNFWGDKVKNTITVYCWVIAWSMHCTVCTVCLRACTLHREYRERNLRRTWRRKSAHRWRVCDGLHKVVLQTPRHEHRTGQIGQSVDVEKDDRSQWWVDRILMAFVTVVEDIEWFWITKN